MNLKKLVNWLREYKRIDIDMKRNYLKRSAHYIHRGTKESIHNLYNSDY